MRHLGLEVEVSTSRNFLNIKIRNFAGSGHARSCVAGDSRTFLMDRIKTTIFRQCGARKKAQQKFPLMKHEYISSICSLSSGLATPLAMEYLALIFLNFLAVPQAQVLWIVNFFLDGSAKALEALSLCNILF